MTNNHPNANQNPKNQCQLIFGLGNPGEQYQKTRHNIGFEIVDAIAASENFKKGPFKGQMASATSVQAGLKLIKPMTYMNLSGECVAQALTFFKLKPENLLVIYDDLDLPLGKLRFSQKGSAGGHRGIRSMIQHLKTDQFWRLKVGIGRPEHKGQVSNYVLGTFGLQEQELAEKMIDQAAKAAIYCLKEGINPAMNRFHSINLA